MSGLPRSGIDGVKTSCLRLPCVFSRRTKACCRPLGQTDRERRRRRQLPKTTLLLLLRGLAVLAKRVGGHSRHRTAHGVAVHDLGLGSAALKCGLKILPPVATWMGQVLNSDSLAGMHDSGALVLAAAAVAQQGAGVAAAGGGDDSKMGAAASRRATAADIGAGSDLDSRMLTVQRTRQRQVAADDGDCETQHLAFGAATTTTTTTTCGQCGGTSPAAQLMARRQGRLRACCANCRRERRRDSSLRGLLLLQEERRGRQWRGWAARRTAPCNHAAGHSWLVRCA